MEEGERDMGKENGRKEKGKEIWRRRKGEGKGEEAREREEDLGPGPEGRCQPRRSAQQSSRKEVTTRKNCQPPALASSAAHEQLCRSRT